MVIAIWAGKNKRWLVSSKQGNKLHTSVCAAVRIWVFSSFSQVSGLYMGWQLHSLYNCFFLQQLNEPIRKIKFTERDKFIETFYYTILCLFFNFCVLKTVLGSTSRNFFHWAESNTAVQVRQGGFHSCIYLISSCFQRQGLSPMAMGCYRYCLVLKILEFPWRTAVPYMLRARCLFTFQQIPTTEC